MFSTISTVPDVLFLKDVYLTKKTDTYFEPSCYEGEYINYTALPEYFIDLNTWPKISDLQCCSCNLPFRGIPWFIALNKSFKVIDGVQKKVMEVHRVFCTPFCAMWYINNVNDSHIINKWDVLELLREFCSTVLSRKVEYIPEAPSKYEMIQHKGMDGISTQEYRNLLDKLWDEIGFNLSPNK